MINWYYVQGSERVGPVGVEILKNLFLKGELNLESYIWRKGFQNWERLKDVSELDFSSTEIKAQVKEDEKTEIVEEINSPEISFSFDWNKIRDEEELFFIKIGSDRKNKIETNLYGPYSLSELKEAITEKRINNSTLIFAAGMPGWIEIGKTPLEPKNSKLNVDNVIDQAPLFLVVNNEPLPIIALIEHAGIKKVTLLGAGPFQAGHDVICSLYSGSSLKAKNLKLNIEEFNTKEQKAICRVIDMNDKAKKVIQEYAN